MLFGPFRSTPVAITAAARERTMQRYARLWLVMIGTGIAIHVALLMWAVSRFIS